MKNIKIFIVLFLASFICNAQDPSDPSNGVKIYALVKTKDSNKSRHYGSFEELKGLDFSKITDVEIDNRGNKTKMDILLFENLINNSPNLTKLSIGYNISISDFPKIDKENNNLKSLYLTWNDLVKIPDDIDNLKALELFSSSGNKIESLPNNFAKLTTLEVLNLKGSDIKTFPTEILELKNLTILSLSGQINSIPEDIHKISKLIKFEIKNTTISTLPKSFSKLKNLKYIDLSKNQFTTIPAAFLKLKNVEYLSLCGNPLEKTAFIKFLNEIKIENLTIYSSLNETDRLELEKMFPKIKFVEDSCGQL